MIIVAVSGGVDSMVLLDRLYKENHKIIIAHVNYQKREDSYLDEKVILEYIKNKDIIFEKHTVGKDEYKNENFEKQAREIRYNFFREVASKYQIKDVYVAHHKDDYIETYLFQKRRQGLYEYYGIKTEIVYQDITIKRPLLDYYKSEIEKYAKENNIKFHEDYSNKQLIYTRNIIRAELDEYSNEKKDIIFQQSIKDNEIIIIEKQAIKPYLNVKKIDIINFSLFNENMKRRWLYSIIKKYDITLKHLDQIINQIMTTKSFKVTFLDTTIIKSYDIIYVLNNVISDYQFIINNDQEFNKCFLFFKDNYNYKLDKINVEYPYVIRNYKKSDLVELGIDYQKFRKKIKKNKIPFFLRDYLPITIKDNQPVKLI